MSLARVISKAGAAYHSSRVEIYGPIRTAGVVVRSWLTDQTPTVRLEVKVLTRSASIQRSFVAIAVGIYTRSRLPAL